MLVLIRGIGDVGSAVAHALRCGGHEVVLHDDAQPTTHRRRMAFSDAVFDGRAELAGIVAMRVDDLARLRDPHPPRCVLATVDAFDAVLASLRPEVLVDARMRKRQPPEPQLHLAPFTIGLGPNFVAKSHTHVVIETAWGDALGAVIIAGTTEPLAGAPRLIDGFGIERVVYAPIAGTFASPHAIGDRVRAGETVAHVDDVALAAPLDGRLRGLTRSGVPVAEGAKVIEIDPRDDTAQFEGIGERPGRIAAGVVRAVERFAHSHAH